MPDDTQIALRQALGRSHRILLPPLAVALFLGPIETLLTFRAVPGATAMSAIIYYVPLLAIAGLVLEVPAMLLLRRIGARRFIAAAMLLAALAAAATVLAASPLQFFIARTLGFVAQSVMVPAAAFLAATWAPPRTRTGMLSWLAAAATLAPVLSALLWSLAAPYLSAPVAFATLAAAWAAAALWSWRVLADTPAAARWLDAPQQDAMAWARSIERKDRPPATRIDPRLAILAAVAFGLAVSAAAAAQWIGVLLRESTTPRGWFDLILAVIAALAALAWARAADRSGRVSAALTLACGLAAMGFAAAVLKGPMWQKSAGLVAHGAALAAARCMIWSLAGRLAPGTGYMQHHAAGTGRGAVGFAVIDAAGRAGLLAGLPLLGWFARQAENLPLGLLGIVGVLVATLLGAAALKMVSNWE